MMSGDFPSVTRYYAPPCRVMEILNAPQARCIPLMGILFICFYLIFSPLCNIVKAEHFAEPVVTEKRTSFESPTPTLCVDV